jgi:hypothetical protein
MKWSRTFFMTVTLLLLSGAAMAQQPEMGLGSLYGNRNLQFVSSRYVALMPPYNGASGDFLFGFNTMSAKTNDTDYKYFYGLELGGGGAWWSQADMGAFGERDASAGYLLVLVENKLFATGKGGFRPYLGSSIGLGTGTMWSKDVKGIKDNPTGGLDFYGLGLEAGAHLLGKGDYALTISVGADVRALSFGSTTKVIYPIMLNVGVCRWRGPMP